METQTVGVETTLGSLLRYWRQVHGKSQLALSTDTRISQRHLSFVESGRSAPSRELLFTISDALTVPLRDQNAIFLAAGYAPPYPEAEMDTPQMRFLQHAIDQMLEKQEPHPAIVLNKYWDVSQTNKGATRLFEKFVDFARWPKPRNLLRLTFHPEGLRPFMANWQEVAIALLQRARREVVGDVVDEPLAALLRELATYPGFADLQHSAPAQSPVIPVHFRRGEAQFSYFSLITTVGTPQFVTAQELRIECMFPFDAGTSSSMCAT